MPSSSVANDQIENVTKPANETIPEEEDMLTSFFSGIFGSDENKTEPKQPESEDGISDFFSNLFSPDSENKTVTVSNTTATSEDDLLDFFSSFIWDDEKNNKTLSANITASVEIKPNDQLVIPQSKPMIDNYHQLEFHVDEIDKLLEKPDVKKVFGVS